MKSLLLLASLLLPVAANAQKPIATTKPVSYTVGAEKANLYRILADTARQHSLLSGFFLEPGADARVVGEFSPRWVVVNRGGFLYFASAQKLLGYSLPKPALVVSPPATTSESPNSETYHNIQIGPRGGHYYINSHGNKTYVKHK